MSISGTHIPAKYQPGMLSRNQSPAAEREGFKFDKGGGGFRKIRGASDIVPPIVGFPYYQDPNKAPLISETPGCFEIPWPS